MDQQWTVQPGTDVYGSDDKKIGSVDDIQDDYLVVHKGFFFPKDHYIPFSAINSHTEDRINLNVTAEEATNRDWDQVPTATTSTSTTTSGYDNDTTRTGYDTTTTAGYDTTTAPDYDTTTTTTTTDRDMTRSTDTTRRDTDSDRISVPVVEEELTASKRGAERGAVRIETTVSEREESLSVPVTEERVHVERVAVNRDATAADMNRDGATIDVPVYGEEVDMQKRARVVEEVEISKDAVQETRQVTGTVRRDDVNVVETNVSDANTTTRDTARTTTDDTTQRNNR